MNGGETFVYDKAQMLGRETYLDCRGGSTGGALSVCVCVSEAHVD